MRLKPKLFSAIFLSTLILILGLSAVIYITLEETISEMVDQESRSVA